MIEFDYQILRCPITGEQLQFKDISDVSFPENLDLKNGIDLNELKQGFVNSSETFFFPILKDIILLLPYYAILLKEEGAKHLSMSFDKERVFRYYNEITYKEYENSNVYEDSDKFVDFREVTKEYIEASFFGARKYIAPTGKYFLDIASGPIGLKEYLDLSDGYDTRICIDISFNALIQAKRNLTKQKGIFICGDITNIPLQEGVCDTTLSQHTLYHVPKKEQSKGVEELYRVTKKGGTVGIVYNWFYHSWLMNIATLPIQIYRVTRHFAGKFYVRFIDNQKPRLYFFTHPPRWFKKFPFGNKVEFYCWRSVNKEFLKLYVHKGLGGKKLLNFIQKLEKKHPKFFGRNGDYPIVVIKK